MPPDVSDDATPRLNLPYLAAAQAQKHVTMNAALAALDGLVQTAVVSATTAEQPAAPDDGALYVLPPGRTGADWSRFPVGALVRFEAGAWSRIPTPDGFLLHARDRRAFSARVGDAWLALGETLGALQSLERLGLGTQADAANPLAAKLNKALFTARTAGEGGDGDLRFTLNKESAADVLSLLFQSGFSGRAEIGLAGGDELGVKVSGDGAAWVEALRIAPGGQVRQPAKAMVSALRAAGSFSVGASWRPFVFDVATLNAGGAFSTATGKFTCPSAGRYKLAAGFMLDPVSPVGSGVYGAFARNGVITTGTLSLAHQQVATGRPMVSQQAIIEAQAGDALETVVVQAGVGTAPTVFGGQLNYLTIEFVG